MVSNLKIIKLLEGSLDQMPEALRPLVQEAADRLLYYIGMEDKIVDAYEKLMVKEEDLKTAHRTVAELMEQVETLNAQGGTLHVSYDLEEDGCVAMLQEGGSKYCVSPSELAEMLAARRDGRMMIAPKGGKAE